MLALLTLLASLPSVVALSSLEVSVTAAVLLSCVLIRFAPLGRPVSQNRREGYCATIWGFVIPLLPACGPNGVVLVSLAMVWLLGFRTFELRRCVWLLPLLALLGGSVLGEVLVGAGDFFGAIPVYDFARLSAALQWFLSVHAHSWSYLSSLIVLLLVVNILEGHSPLLKPLRFGLACGVVVAALVTVAQFLETPIFSLPNQTAFWSKLKRFSGTFSDPNAQGVFLGLAPFVILSNNAMRRWSVWLLIALAVWAGLLSGSRTFIVALAVSAMGLSWVWSRRAFGILVGLAIFATLGISILDSYSAGFTSFMSSPVIPEGIRRVVYSCSFERLSESFFSRAVFLKMGIELFSYSPLFGVGADNFRAYVPALGDKLGLGLGGWVDNSNNFYLGVLTELGLFGFLALILTIRGRRVVATAGDSRGILGLVVLGVLLLTGPHLDFPEVLVIAACLIAASSSCIVRSRSWVLSWVVLFSVVGGLAVLTRDRGAYDWEVGGDTWLSPVASISVACGCDGLARLSLEAVYVPSHPELLVNVRSELGEERVVRFERAGLQSVTLSCIDVPQGVLEYQPGTIRVSVRTEPGWSPSRAWPGRSSDSRLLGVKLHDRTWRDLFGAERCVRPVTRPEMDSYEDVSEHRHL